MKTYEGMFLVEAGIPDFQTASEPIRTMFERTEADVLALNPWEERRLAYDIRGRKRGLYVLAYFKLDPARVSELEHECELDERVLRSMILRKDKLTDEQINIETPAVASNRKAAEAAMEAEAAAEAETAAEAAPAEPAPAEAPADATPEVPAETPAETPAEAPAEAPADVQPEAPAEASADEQPEAPAEAPAEEESEKS